MDNLDEMEIEERAVDAATEELRSDTLLHSMLRAELTTALNLPCLPERTRAGNSVMVAKVCDAIDENAALRRKVTAAEGMSKALVPFTCGAREVYPGEPCEDFGFQQKGTSAKVHAALTAWQEASRG